MSVDIWTPGEYITNICSANMVYEYENIWYLYYTNVSNESIYSELIGSEKLRINFFFFFFFNN